MIAKFYFLTSVHLMTFPFALYSDPWNIFTLVIDSMHFPSIGLTTLKQRQREEIEAALEVRRATSLTRSCYQLYWVSYQTHPCNISQQRATTQKRT